MKIFRSLNKVIFTRKKILSPEEEKNKWRRLSFKTEYKIEFLVPFTGTKKVLGNIPAHSLSG